MVSIVKSLPKTEDGHGILCKTHTAFDYQISQNTSKKKNRFTLWKILENGYEKVASADTPQDLYPLVPWKKSTRREAQRDE